MYLINKVDTGPAGARTSTVLQRLACLPLADALVSENGGRIFVHDPLLPTAAKFVEDTDWCHALMPMMSTLCGSLAMVVSVPI